VTLTFDPMTLTPLTFDFEHLRRIACVVMKLCTKFECNRAIRGGVIAISVFDLMTLNIALGVALGSEIIFSKFDLRQLNRAWIIVFFSGCPTLVGKASSFIHELSFFVYQSTALNSHGEDGHQMYFGGSVIGKASTIGLGISSTPPLYFQRGSKSAKFDAV